MLYKYIIPIIMICFSFQTGFSKDQEIILDSNDSQNTQLIFETQPLLKDHPLNTSLSMNYSTSQPLSMNNSSPSKPKTWKYKLGEIFSCAYAECCGPQYRDEGTAAVYLSPGCVVAPFTLGIPGCVACSGHTVSNAVWVAGGVTAGGCSALIPTWLIGGSITICCAECCNSSGKCTEFLEPVHKLKYEWSVSEQCERLENTINKWNAHMTSPENNEQKVIELFTSYLKNTYEIEIVWGEKGSLKPLKERAQSAFKDGDKTDHIKNVLTDFYNHEGSKGIRPKNFDVINSF